MEFLDPELDDYVSRHSSPEPELLQALKRETHIKVLHARMLSGHLQGRVLSMITHMLKPMRVLEIGTYTGYSAICLAEGLPEGGVVHTIDINEELEPLVRKYITLSGNDDRIKLYIGHALEVLPTLSGPYDLVFIDADKINYIHYYKAVFDKVAHGGYIMADNVLWSGKVTDKVEAVTDADTAAIVAFNKFVQEDERVENVLFPIRDGLMMARKKTI